MQIDISTNALGWLCICTVRYSLGRNSYAPDMTIGTVTAQLMRLDMNDRIVMARDIREALNDDQFSLPQADTWREFLTRIEATL